MVEINKVGLLTQTFRKQRQHDYLIDQLHSMRERKENNFFNIYLLVFIFYLNTWKQRVVTDLRQRMLCLGKLKEDMSKSALSQVESLFDISMKMSVSDCIISLGFGKEVRAEINSGVVNIQIVFIVMRLNKIMKVECKQEKKNRRRSQNEF